ncbi:citrate transporter-domain containing protein [Nitzschia inconspicua]|uniref:Citrate transporter-domain containing protein n=1 Tax=Nitzschia inconspicua TaxID=303405 RepID=A0A9K3PGI9_9STRA|nr:citrate transporter-domain containing protein [Nitzschia inconspicua]
MTKEDPSDHDDRITDHNSVPRANALPPVDEAVAANADDVNQPKHHRLLLPSQDLLTFAPAGVAGSVTTSHRLFADPKSATPELMGPILRRKKVVSMPLGASGDFFFREEAAGAPTQGINAGHPNTVLQRHLEGRQHQRQLSHTGPGDRSNLKRDAIAPPESPKTNRSRQNSKQNSFGGFMNEVIRRKQVSLDLLGPNDFFLPPPPPVAETESLLPTTPERDGDHEDAEEAVVATLATAKLIRPLRFAPRLYPKQQGSGGHHGGGAGARLAAVEEAPAIDEETTEAFQRYSQANEALKLQISSLSNYIKDGGLQSSSISQCLERIQETHSSMEPHERQLKIRLGSKSIGTRQTMSTMTSESVPDGDNTSILNQADSTEENPRDQERDKKFDNECIDDGIIRATTRDKIKTVILFFLMLGLTIVFATWDTHLDEEIFIVGPVGKACISDCMGNETTLDFFNGHNHFEEGEVIHLLMHLDPNEIAHEREAYLTVEVIGIETQQVKATQVFGIPDDEERLHQEESIMVDFDHPDEPHVINVIGSEEGVSMTFTLSAQVQSHISGKSELVAALIMVAVYFFILIEVIHRTLVAVFGSMIALMFFFIMNEGETESIARLMLHLEWSTLALLFGMMLLVGELSNTGIFEWCAVRLLVASKGSFVRLIVLLCVLTAFASAFLDNVTTMLLVAPVTIDMCNILDVDPRPYLIGEVLLSNIGGTATLIGDPPNIIIGSSFSEIGFVDFIIHVLPCIFLFCVPVSLAMICWIYRHYLTTTKMRVLDIAKLKRTYPIYDQPRLMIAGTSTFFVIVMFFLHPVHHKDTAWIALLGAFITIAFTNPHDVQDALRNHVEWDTLLFFAGLFVLVEVCAAMGLLRLIGDGLASYIELQPAENQLSIAITLLIWVSAITSAFLDNIPYTATMIPIVQILSNNLPDTLPLETLAWALSFGACLGGNGTLLGASANIVTAGISTNKGFEISFLNFLYPGMLVMIATVAISNLYMLVRYVWAA